MPHAGPHHGMSALLHLQRQVNRVIYNGDLGRRFLQSKAADNGRAIAKTLLSDLGGEALDR